MNEITLDLGKLPTEMVRKIAYVLVDGCELPYRGDRTRIHRQFRATLAELESRANGGDVSELVELEEGFRLAEIAHARHWN
jgi:hypothetical protein